MRPSDVRRLRGGLLAPASYRATGEVARTSTEPFTTIRRYVDANAGDYPWTTAVRTPTGPVRLTLPHPHDVRTLVEVFFRHDYGDSAPRVVLDAGANIGVAAAYFLSRRPDSRVHCWEPAPSNQAPLRANLVPFGDRVVRHEHALAPTAGSADFRVEGVGRYGGLADYYEHTTLDTRTVRVGCDAFADALAGVVEAEGAVDLLKIDTEGSEEALLASVPDDLLAAVGTVVYESGGRVRRRTGAQLVAERS